MDHNEAVQLQAAIKYVLGELSQSQREEYEEHYFDCGACAVDVKAATAFVDTSREIFRREAQEHLERQPVPVRSTWFGWLGPIVAVPAFVALLLVVAYQNMVTIPNAKKMPVREVAIQTQAGLNTAQLFTSSFALHAANTRGGEESSPGDEDKFKVRPEESIALRFDFTPKQVLDSYEGWLVDASGREVFRVTVPGSSTNKEAQLVFPAKLLQPGKYALVFTADRGSHARPSKEKEEVLRLPFAIEFLR